MFDIDDDFSLCPSATIKATKEKYDFIELESRVNDCYNHFLKDDNQSTRTDLFRSIKNLAFGILLVKKEYKSAQLDYYKVSYEYALYLLLRIVCNGYRFRTDFKRIAFFKYISLNIKHIALGHKNKYDSQLTYAYDIEFLIDYNEHYDLSELPEHETIIDKELNAAIVYKLLSIFYSKDDIKRYFELSQNLIYKSRFQPLSISATKDDIYDFTMVYLALAKRISATYNFFDEERYSYDNLDTAIASSLRSSTFLALFSEMSNIPKEFLLSLDIQSLYRLTTIAGGKKIKIPHLRELDTLIGASVSASKAILEGKNEGKFVDQSKKDYNLVYSNSLNISKIINAILDIHTNLGPDLDSNPILKIFAMNMKSFKKIFSSMIEDGDDLTCVKDVLNDYIDQLIQIENLLEEKNGKNKR